MTTTPPDLDRAAAVKATDRERWNRSWKEECEWHEWMEPSSFVAVYEHPTGCNLVMIFIIFGILYIILLLVHHDPVGNFFCILVMAAPFIFFFGRPYRSADQMSLLEVGPARTKFLARAEAFELDTRSVTGVEFYRLPPSEDYPAEWAVRFVHREGARVLPLWSTEGVARHRAERLREVFRSLQCKIDDQGEREP